MKGPYGGTVLLETSAQGSLGNLASAQGDFKDVVGSCPQRRRRWQGPGAFLWGTPGAVFTPAPWGKGPGGVSQPPGDSGPSICL